MFPTAHYGIPEATQASLPQIAVKSCFQERTKAWQAPGHVRPACQPCSCLFDIFKRKHVQNNGT